MSCPFRVDADAQGKRPCRGLDCELWDDQDHRCDFTSMVEYLREIRDSLTVDKQPGEPVEGELLETLPLIPEFPIGVGIAQALDRGWWPMLGEAVFDWDEAMRLKKYWETDGYDVKIERVFSEPIIGSSLQLFRLWFRRKKAA